MDLVNNMNKVVDYIEDNLTDEIDKEILARLAMCSSYHLSRMFPFVTGITLSDYIRRRRLSVAGLELSQNNISVLDVALKYGYESPTAFTQAFKNMHKITPSQAKEKSASLVFYPKLYFQLSIKGDVAMNFSIVQRDSFQFIGMKNQIKKVNGDEDFSRIMELWNDLQEDLANKLMSLSNGYFEGLVGASANNQDDNYDYFIGVSCDEQTVVKDLEVLNIPALDWAVFKVIGTLPDAMVDVWKRIFMEWFPSSGYESVNAPCLEIYSDGDIYSKKYHCELWIPIKKIL